MQYALNYSGARVKITQFPGGFRLKSNPRDTWYSLFSAIVDEKLLFKQNAMC